MKAVMAVLLALVVLVGWALLPTSASATIPYHGYTYSSDREVRSIAGYVYAGSIDGTEDPAIGAFNRPESLYFAEDGMLYIVDSGNNRIVQLDRDRRYVRSFGDAEGQGALSEPKGVYVKADGTVYAADTKNGRIVVFDAAGAFVRDYPKPESPLIGSTFSYSPSKLVLDKRDYMYVVSEGNTQGLLQIDPAGQFRGFYGANHVGFSWSRLFVKLIATEAQQRKLSAIVPAEFSNLELDDEGFMYTTTLGEQVNQLKRLSPVGVDTLNLGTARPYGDLYTVGPFAMASFIGVTVSPEGIISALDLQTSKVFQYDKLGNFLFSFGGTGEQNGLFVTPSDLKQDANGNLYVVDRGRNRIDMFRTTPFADLVHEASTLYVDGRYSEAEALWQEVLRVNGNYEMAYIAIGKAMYKAERYREAMDYFELAGARGDYSVAFKEYRKEFVREHFAVFAIGAILLFVALRWGVPWLVRAIAVRGGRASWSRQANGWAGGQASGQVSVKAEGEANSQKSGQAGAQGPGAGKELTR